MALSPEEAEDIREILVVLYGDQFSSLSPTERTLELTELVLLEVQKCDKRIYKLLSSLACAATGKGWLRRCTGAMRRAMKNNSLEFRGCSMVAARNFKTEIYISMN